MEEYRLRLGKTESETYDMTQRIIKIVCPVPKIGTAPQGYRICFLILTY